MEYTCVPVSGNCSALFAILIRRIIFWMPSRLWGKARPHVHKTENGCMAGFGSEDDLEQELDGGRQVKSFECHLVDKLLDMSVSSLLSAASSRQLSGQLIGQHQQAKFGRFPIQNRLSPSASSASQRMPF